LAVGLLVVELFLDLTCSPFLSVCEVTGNVMGAAARTLFLLVLLAVVWQFRASIARLVATMAGVDPGVILGALGMPAGATDAGDAVVDVLGTLFGTMKRRTGTRRVDRGAPVTSDVIAGSAGVDGSPREDASGLRNRGTRQRTAEMD